METKLFVLNVIYAITDTFVSALGVCAFGWGAWNFGKWWILLFTIVPLALFNAHTLIINEDIEAQKEGESDSKT